MFAGVPAVAGFPQPDPIAALVQIGQTDQLRGVVADVRNIEREAVC